MKKGVTLILLISMIFILWGCDSNELGSETNTPLDEPEVSIEPMLDLSAYDAHGNWSCGRMWVHRNTGTYNQASGEYGYIDEEGNLIGE